MEYDTKKMDVDLAELDGAIGGSLSAPWKAFWWSKTPQGYEFWAERKHTTDDLREIRRQYLEQLDTPFGDLGEYTQNALRECDGPWEFDSEEFGWMVSALPGWYPGAKYRLARRTTDATRENVRKVMAEPPTETTIDGKRYKLVPVENKRVTVYGGGPFDAWTHACWADDTHAISFEVDDTGAPVVSTVKMEVL